MEKKYKVLVLSDHALSTSGVGCQTRFLLEGLIKKGRWSFRQFGAAIKHANYEPVEVNPDFIIKPIDGFGNRNLIMQASLLKNLMLYLSLQIPGFLLGFMKWKMK